MSIEIIAEIAQGHEGKPEQAYLLARAGISSGADSIKFQCVYADDTCVPTYRHYEFFKQLEMPDSIWEEIHRLIKTSGKRLVLNIGGERSLQLAKAIGVEAVKLHSTHFFCTELIRKSILEFRKVYISLGGISAEEIDWFIRIHGLTPEANVSFTYGFQSSPTPIDKNNLRKIATLKGRYPGFAFGFEDHTDAFDDDRFHVSLVALSLGITHIERHLTLDPLLKLEDAESALTASDFMRFVQSVRRLEPCLGSGDLSLTKLEHEYRGRVLKSVVAATELGIGEAITFGNVALKRSPEADASTFLRIEDVIGKKTLVNIPVNSIVKHSMLG